METTKKFFTVSKADVFSVTLNQIVFSVEASHLHHRVVTFETETLKLKNAINKVEHQSLSDAHEYIEILSNVAHDKKQLLMEQGI